jgi:diguanylate cyclase
MAGDDAPAGDPASRSVTRLRERVRALNARAQQGAVDEQSAAIAELDAVLADARHGNDPALFGLLLANTAATRVASAAAGHRADHLISELLDHARRTQLWLGEAAAHACLARQAVFAGRESGAMTHAATALAVLDEGGEPCPWLPRDVWRHALANTVNSVALVLAQVGLFEQAAPLLERAQRTDEQSGDPHNLAVLLVNRVRILLGWALALERAGRRAEAADRVTTAARTARELEGPWRRSLFPESERPAADVVPVVGAAHALADPQPCHLGRLRVLLDRSVHARERISVGIAAARCLDTDGRRPEAVRTLQNVRRHLVGDSSEPSLAVSLAYEIARLGSSVPAKRAYADALEAELWLLHEARVATVRTRLVNAVPAGCADLTAEGSARDPLTGLPDGRALSRALGNETVHPEWLPLSVAIVGLDRTPDDATRRAVAETLRDSLRGDDVVARYREDEFAVLLPLTSPTAAEAVLTRTARAVAGLTSPCNGGGPGPLGATVSVGLTAARSGEPPDAVVARATTALDDARRDGGNHVRWRG